MARDPIAALFTTILDRLEALVPMAEHAKANLAHDPDPKEPPEAGISTGVLFPDEDGFWDEVRTIALCDFLVGDEKDSAHVALQRQTQVGPLVEAFQSLLDLLDTRCPVLHASFLRLNVTAWRHRPGDPIQFGAYLYGKALSGLSDGTNTDRGKRFAKMVRALSLLDKPTDWWLIEADGCPVAAAGCLQACAVYEALDSESFQIQPWLKRKAKDPACSGLRLTAPAGIQADALRLLAKA